MHRSIRLSSATLAIALFTTAMAAAEEVIEENIRTQYERIRLVRIVGGLENPWSVAFLPDGGMLVTERPGRLQLIRDGEKAEVSGLPGDIHARAQGGLLEVALHPDFENNRWVYLTYSKGDADETATTLIRGRLDDGSLSDVEELFTQNNPARPGGHYGSRLLFADDGTLFMSIGERSRAQRAQDLMDHSGKLLRLNDDGSAPDDNPFAGRDDALPEIYSWGHRNIQGLVQHPETGEIWTTEHGPRGGDRLDRIQRGENYGWPVVSYGLNYRTQEQWGEGREQEGMVRPLHEFLPTLAPSGLALVTGEHFPAWEDNLLAGGLRSQQIRRIVIRDGVVVHEEELLRDTIGRIRDIRIGPDGFIYIATDERDGGIYRVEPVE